MMNKENAERLIADLLNDPIRFNKLGRSNDLLKEYFRGYSIETLIPLLESDNIDIKREAVWIVSELGQDTCNQLIDYIVPLIDCPDISIRYSVMECILLGTSKSHYEYFTNIISQIICDEEFIRLNAIFLISNANDIQLKHAIEFISKHKFDIAEIHIKGLSALMNYDSLDETSIIEMLNSKNTVLQLYGAMIAKRNVKRSPYLMEHALLSKNQDVKKFAERIIR